MYKNYKVISVTPAGRKQNLQLLNRYLIDFYGLIDEHHFWVNTTNKEDIEYIRNVCESNSTYFKFCSSRIPVNGINSIYHFFKEYTDPYTLYVRFDDDICYIDPNAIHNLLEFRLEHPEFFLVYPVIINNSMNNMLNSPFKEIKGNWFTDKEHILKKHNTFIEMITEKKVNQARTSNYILDHSQRANINCISWMGKEFQKFKGEVGREEEEWLARTAPRLFKKNNAICGNSIVAHYSFRPQKKFLDQTKILHKYKKIKDIKLF